MKPQRVKSILTESLFVITEAEDFTSRKTDVDSTTGATSWDIEYEDVLTKTYSQLSTLVKRFQNHVNNISDNKELRKLYDISKNLKNRLARIITNTGKSVKETATSQGGASMSAGEGMQYSTPKAFSKNKNKYYYKLGLKPVPNKIKGSGLEVKQLWEEETKQFQQDRITEFDKIEEGLNSLAPALSNAKNNTINYYSANPGDDSILISTDLILNYIDNIKTLLKGEE